MCEHSKFLEKNIESFYEKCANLAPFSRVLFISSERFFLLYGKKIVLELYKRQLYVTTILYKDYNKFNIKLASYLFNVADDIRLCITFEKELFSLCFYFASIKRIPALVSTKPEHLDCALQKSINFCCEPFTFYDDRYVYIRGEKNYFETYSAIVIKRLSLIDYNVKCIVHKKRYDNEYFLAIKELENFDYTEPKVDMLFDTDKNLSLLNFNSGGELFNNNPIWQAKQFYDLSSLECLFLSREYYTKIMEESKNHFNIVDYNLRAEKLSSILNVNSDKIRKNVKNQLTYLENNKLLVDLAFRLLINEVEEILKFIELAIDIVYKLGAEKKKVSEKQNKFSFLVCDNSSFFNSATLFREFIGFSV